MDGNLTEKALIHRAKRVPLRQAFPHEAWDFTTWLEKNIDALADEVGLQLSVLDREHGAADFRVDLLCQDGEGKRVIVENQLELADTSQLGAVLIYMVNLEAKTAIWVTSGASPSYVNVLNWLNQSTPADVSFYLVRAEAINIDNAPDYAPLFTLVTGPDKQSKNIGQARQEFAAREQTLNEFWKGLLEKTGPTTRLFDGVSPTGPWLQAQTGKRGIFFEYDMLMYSAWVQLHFDFRTSPESRAAYNALLAEKDAIEAEVGEPLEWELFESKARVIKRFKQTSLMKPDTWPPLQDRMVDILVRLENALIPRLQAIMT